MGSLLSLHRQMKLWWWGQHLDMLFGSHVSQWTPRKWRRCSLIHTQPLVAWIPFLVPSGVMYIGAGAARRLWISHFKSSIICNQCFVACYCGSRDSLVIAVCINKISKNRIASYSVVFNLLNLFLETFVLLIDQYFIKSQLLPLRLWFILEKYTMLWDWHFPQHWIPKLRVKIFSLFTAVSNYIHQLSFCKTLKTMFTKSK